MSIYKLFIVLDSAPSHVFFVKVIFADVVSIKNIHYKHVPFSQMIHLKNDLFE